MKQSKLTQPRDIKAYNKYYYDNVVKVRHYNIAIFKPKRKQKEETNIEFKINICRSNNENKIYVEF